MEKADAIIFHDKNEQKRIRIKEIAKEMWTMRFDDSWGIENYFFEELFQEHLAISVPEVVGWFDYVFKHQKAKKKWYGDIDWTITKLYDGIYTSPRRMVESIFDKGRKMNIGGQKKRIQVLHYDDHCSCAEHTNFLIFKETINIGDREEITFHVRRVWPKSDYTKGNQYVHRPNIKWYKDREWNLEYIDKLHTTPLGGSYGDLRDEGYVFTAKKTWHREDGWDVERGAMPYFWQYNMVTRILASTALELKERN